MSATIERIESALHALGAGALGEPAIERHVAPLFSRAIARNAKRVYLANHSLGRPLDAMEEDVREALAAWYADLGGAWQGWLDEREVHRARLARLLGAIRADSVVPKTSAGQGLRAVLNAYERPPRVVATRGEFDSLDLILRDYAQRGRIALAMTEPRADGDFAADDLRVAIDRGCDLLVVSQVLFQTGQIVRDLPALIEHAHRSGARVMLDVYHSLGVIPIDIAALDVDFAIGGSYKYLRGGPGACFLYVAPRLLDAGLRTPDSGWFAKAAPFDYARPDPPQFASGGDAWLESTPPILTWYQARSGQVFTQAIGVARLRAYSLALQRLLVDELAKRGIEARGGDEGYGAFVVVRRDDAVALARGLRERGIDVDARGTWLRLCPDVLTTRGELDAAADALAAAVRR
jgi:kynureninase